MTDDSNFGIRVEARSDSSLLLARGLKDSEIPKLQAKFLLDQFTQSVFSGVERVERLQTVKPRRQL
jgi:hypothetical protein